MSVLHELAQALIEGRSSLARDLTEKALAAGHSPKDVLDSGLVAGMSVVGERFKRNDIFIPEVLLSARAMRAGMEVLKPLLASTGATMLAKVILGTVQGDLHDIGKDLVGMMLEGAGFQVINLGVNVSPDSFVQAVSNENAPLLAMSALLSTTMRYQRDTLEALKKAGLRDRVKVLIGGAPVTQEYADYIGADGYAPDAASAVEKAKELVG